MTGVEARRSDYLNSRRLYTLATCYPLQVKAFGDRVVAQGLGREFAG
jgi:hypothetical protein